MEFVSSLIPCRRDFKTALSEFEIDCVIPYIGKEVLGAFPYGSVNRDDCNEASDIDYLMVISDPCHKARIRETTRTVREKYHVPMDVLAVPEHRGRPVSTPLMHPSWSTFASMQGNTDSGEGTHWTL